LPFFLGVDPLSNASDFDTNLWVSRFSLVDRTRSFGDCSVKPASPTFSSLIKSVQGSLSHPLYRDVFFLKYCRVLPLLSLFLILTTLPLPTGSIWKYILSCIRLARPDPYQKSFFLSADWSGRTPCFFFFFPVPRFLADLFWAFCSSYFLEYCGPPFSHDNQKPSLTPMFHVAPVLFPSWGHPLCIKVAALSSPVTDQSFDVRFFPCVSPWIEKPSPKGPLPFLFFSLRYYCSLS